MYGEFPWVWLDKNTLDNYKNLEHKINKIVPIYDNAVQATINFWKMVLFD